MRLALLTTLLLPLAATGQEDPGRAELIRRVGEWVEQEAADLPDGWKVLRSEHYVMVTDVDKRKATRLLDHAEAQRGHLDREFAYLAVGAVPTAVMRYFEKEQEQQDYVARNGDLHLDRIVLALKHGNQAEWELGKLGERVAKHWLYYANPNLYSVLPYWFREGFMRYVGWCVPSGKSVRFKIDPYNRKMVREHIQRKQYTPLRELITGPDPQMVSDRSSVLAGSLVSYLLTDGRRRWPNLVESYAANLKRVLADVEKELDIGPDSMATADRTARETIGTKLKNEARRVQEQAAAATFADFDEKTWDVFESSWLGYAK